MKRKLTKICSCILAAAFVISSISAVIPALVSADDAKTPVLPFAPFSVSGIGGTKVDTAQSDKLFTETDVAVISSDSVLQGVIADAPPKDNSVSAVMKVNPMSGGIGLTHNFAAVNHSFEKTVGITEEKGLKISSATGKEQVYPDANASQAYANIEFSKRNSFVGADGIMFYVKLDAANIIFPNFVAFKPASTGRWSYDFNPSLMLAVGKEYSYRSLSDTSWKTANAVVGTKGNPNYGMIKFGSAFEGYIKIPFDSLYNDLGFKFNPYTDSFSHMCIKAEGIGGKYGTITSGPYFVVNKDSTSTKMEINNSFVPAPSDIGASINGFRFSLQKAEALLVYVKTDSANRITVSASMWDDYLGDIPSLILKPNTTVYTAALGDNKWSKVKTKEVETGGAVEFGKAFEGYIKIPLESLKEEDASPFIAIYPEIDFITGVKINVAGIGGKYGKIETVPFLINDDKGTTSFELSDEYKKPEEVVTEVVPVLGTELLNYNWATVSHQEVKPLDYTAAKGTVMSAISTDGYEESNLNNSQAYANFKLSKAPLSGYEGLVFYVKLDSANVVMPQISLTIPTDKTRWQWSWNPTMMLKVGSTYEYMPLSGEEWKTGTVIEGTPGNSFFGAVEFDSAFEGYIKVPFTSLDNDMGYDMVPELDTVDNIVYRSKGLGGSYGDVTFGPSFFVTVDGSKGLTLKEADPIIVTPVTDWTSADMAPNSDQSVVTPLDWVSSPALKISSDSEYTNNYPASSLAYARMQMKDGFALGKATHIIMYVKTDSANTILPSIVYSGAALNIGYDPAMTLGVGKSYSYLPIGAKKWTTASAIRTWQSNSGDTNGDGVSDTYFGGMRFDAPFEGYIKFAIADLSNDYGYVNAANRETTIVSAITVSAAKLGGKYGSIVAGPIFLTENDTDSPEIKLYEEQSENANAAITAEPLKVSVKANGIEYKKLNPFRGLTLEGYTLSSEKGWEVATKKLYESENVFAVNTNTSLKGSNALLIYVKADKDTVIAPKVILGNSAAPVLSLGVGSKYELLSFKTAKWSRANAVAASDSDTYNGAFSIKAGFEGYIKLPYSSLANEKGFTFNADSEALGCVEFRLSSLGGSGNTVTLAPISLVTNNGGSSEVIYPASYDSADPYERIQGIFERSRQGLAQGNYYMVGDSTRHLYGYPIFRLVRNALKENYNMNCVVHAQSGLKAEHWSNYTPGLDGPSQPTVDMLIDKIPGTGRNSIVDIALAINDSWQSGDKIYEFLKKAIDEIRKAKPEVVIVYTSPTLVDAESNNDNMRAAAKKVWADSSIYKIDVMNNVMAGYYPQYYSDGYHPNSEGYKLAANYIISQYLGTPAPEKIIDIDTNSYTLPTGAKPITDSLKITNQFNTTSGTYSMNVNGVSVSSVKVNGTIPATGNAPFDTANFVEMHLSKHLNGNDYIAFYLKLPAANKLGLRAFGMSDNREIIFKRDMPYYVMPLGGKEWTKKMSGHGLNKSTETYGAIEFDSAFEGWVKLPLSGFYASPSAYEDINGMTFRFSELGGDYGEVRVGSFFAISDEPYTAKNVWNKSDLPEMEPLGEITSLDGAPWVFRDFLPSPIPYLSTNKALVIGSDPVADYTYEGYCYSSHWAGTKYNDVSLDEYTHLMFYVKVPKTKDNHLTTWFFTDKNQQTTMANTDYQLLPLGSNKWEYYLFERTVNQEGGFFLPAGFEGFIKLPIASIISAGTLEGAKLNQIIYRFAYIGMGDERVIVGPVFGVTKDNDPGPQEVVYTSLPAATTIKSIYAPEEGDIFTDRIMLYWEEFEGAKYYMLEAYSVEKTDSGYEYRLVSKNRCVTGCGVATDLMPGRRYALLVKAYDLMDKQLAIYDYTIVKTIEEDYYKYPVISNTMKYDKVYYAQDKQSVGGSESVALYAVIGGAAVVLLGGLAIVFIVARKRRKKDA